MSLVEKNKFKGTEMKDLHSPKSVPMIIYPDGLKAFFGHGEIIIFTHIVCPRCLWKDPWLQLFLSQFQSPQLPDICIQGNWVFLFGCLSDSGVYTNYNDNNVIVFFIILVILASRTPLMPL